jgi:N4-gp56 family major capsid protein
VPDAFTTTASLESVQAAFNRHADFALRPQLFFDQCADVKPTAQAMPGSSVKFTIYTDLSVATTALVESVDVDAVALNDGQVTVTLVEQGNAVLTTAKLVGTSFLDIHRDAANMVGFNAGISLDTLARTPLGAGSNVIYSGNATARNTVGPDDTITAGDIREARADLVGASVMPWQNGYFRGFIHPDVAVDLRTETGVAAWREPHVYSQPGEIWNGSIGCFEGIEFLETPRAEIVADAGSSTTLTDVYKTVVVGQQALAKAYSHAVSAPTAQIVRGEVTDKLRRLTPLGWYWLGGYARFREESLYRIESSSSLGTNT